MKGPEPAPPPSPGAGTRTYRMTARREAVERNRRRILETAYHLFLEQPYDEVTLDTIAEAAGVTRQTLHRQFGSKDDLLVAVIEWRRPEEDAVSAAPRPGDADGAVAMLVQRYERIGDAVVRFLVLEGRHPAVDRLLASGRDAHRAEIERLFDPFLPGRSRARDEAVLSLYAATDLMVWKLLRRDFGRSPAETEAVVRRLVRGVLATLTPTTPEEGEE